jgi:Fels-1 Prophage Protein-like
MEPAPVKSFNKSLLAGAMLLCLGQFAFADSKPNGAISYPTPGGVICDQKSGFCADEQGVSVAITEMELGKKASKNLMDQINSVGIKDFDPTSFTMTGGLHCETKQKKCFTNKYDNVVDIKATKALFGK